MGARAEEEAAFAALQPKLGVLLAALQSPSSSLECACRELRGSLWGVGEEARRSESLEALVELPLRKALLASVLASSERSMHDGWVEALVETLGSSLAVFSSPLDPSSTQPRGSLLLGRLVTEATLPDCGERRLSVVLSATEALWRRADVVACHRDALPFVAHQTFLLLQILERPKLSQESRLAALSALRLVCGQSLEVEDPKNVLAVSLASLLPGLSIGLGRLAAQDPNTHHRIICSCLDLLASLLASVVSDGELATKRAPKSEEWFRETGTRLHSLLQHLATRLTAHSQTRVREALMRLAATVMGECGESLSGCVGICVDVMAALVLDSQPQLAQLASDTAQAALQANGLADAIAQEDSDSNQCCCFRRAQSARCCIRSPLPSLKSPPPGRS